jgi:hypothetical protein
MRLIHNHGKVCGVGYKKRIHYPHKPSVVIESFIIPFWLYRFTEWLEGCPGGLDHAKLNCIYQQYYREKHGYDPITPDEDISWQKGDKR